VRRLPAALVTVVLMAVALTVEAGSAAADANDRRVIATSVEGRPIVARHYGAVDAPVQLVVIGQMHGSEPGGRSVAAEIAGSPIPDGVGVWVLASVNPDGHRHGTRGNAHGVDLNRNFPENWDRAGRGGLFWSGHHSASEPETRGVMRFLSAVRPAALLSFHQAYDMIDISHPRSAHAGRQLARWMGERAASVGCPGPCHGTLTQWVDQALGAIALTVELDDRVSTAEARRAAGAVLRLGTWLGR
jgi:murein peptide amidase A